MCCSALGSGVQHAMSNVANFVRTLPVPGNIHGHVVVVTFVLRRHKTNIQIEIQELEGGVRATGLLCLLGISVGLGSIFVYRLYTRLFCSVNAAAARSRKRRLSDLCSSASLTAASQNNVKSPDLTPDSGIVVSADSSKLLATDTPQDGILHRSTPNRIPRSYSEMAGLHLRGAAGSSLDDAMFGENSLAEAIHQQFRRTWAVENWLARAADISSLADSMSDIFPPNQPDLFADDAGLRDGPAMDSSFVSRWSSADHGFASGWMTESAEFASQDISVAQPAHQPSTQHLDPASANGNNNNNNILPRNDHSDQSGLNTLNNNINASNDPIQLFNVNAPPREPPYVRRRLISEGDGRRWRQRRRFSLASSVLSSDYDYRESLVSKGFSVDLGEDLDGMMTPPRECGVDGRVEGMESLHLALQQIQRDIDDMNRKFDGLRSSAVVDPLCADDDYEPPAQRSAVTFSCGGTSDRDDDDAGDLSERDSTHSARQELDYMWDYRSDLVHNSRGHRFEARRPIVHSNSSHFFRNLPRNFSDLGSIADVPVESYQDMYIDDEFVAVPAAFSVPNLPTSPLPEICRKRSRDEMSDDHSSVSSSSKSSRSAEAHSSHANHRRYGNVSSMTSVCGGCARHRANYSCSHSESCCCGEPHCGFAASSGCHAVRRLSVPSHQCCHHCAAAPPQSHLNTAAPPSYTSHHCDVQSYHCSQTTSPPCHVPPPPLCHCTNILSRLPINCQLGSGDQINRTPAQGNSVHENFSSSSSSSSCDHCNNPIVETGMQQLLSGCCVGDKVDVVHAAETLLAQSRNERKSCLEMLRLFGVRCLRPVSRDVYSVLRCVVYSALLDNLPILSRSGNLNDCIQRLTVYSDTRHKYLRCWNDARLMTTTDSVDTTTVHKLVQCLRVLYEQVEIVGRLTSVSQRDQYLCAVLNGNQSVDCQLMEGVKVIMMLSLIAAYESSDNTTHTTDGSVNSTAGSPVAVWQLMQRDTSLTAEMFFHNHINCDRDMGPLCSQQLELSLLAYCLGVRLQVFQSSCVSQSDALRHFPDQGADHLPLVRIIRSDQNLTQYYIPVGAP